MSSIPNRHSNVEEHPTADGPLPEFVDWVLGAIIALSGVATIVGGTALMFGVNRDTIAESIEEGTVTVTIGMTELSDAETLEVTETVVSWTGPGLLLTGFGMVVFAIAYVAVRRRAHRRARTDESVSSYGSFAVLGAVATAVLSFLPVSPAIGGALAGYLERGESNRTVSVGALAGLLPMLPVLTIAVSALGGLIAGLLTIDEVGSAVIAGATLFFVMMFVGTVGAGLGALGGYVGGRFAESRATTN